MKPRGSLTLCALLFALLLMVFDAAPAGAKLVVQKLPFTLGPVGEPNAIAIDQATGNVYVTDHATNTVKIFGSEGGAPGGGVPTEVNGTETPSKAFRFLSSGEAAGIAVDESGDLYVTDLGDDALDEFKLEGGHYRYLCQFTGFGNTGDGCLPNLATHETSPAEPFSGPDGVAVDAHGNVYVSNYGSAGNSVYEFNSAGEDARETAIPGEPSGIAVAPNGTVYVQDYQGPIYKLTPKGSSEFEVEVFDTEKSYAVAVDPATNDVYVDHREYVTVREPSGGVVFEIRPGIEFGPRGVGVPASSGDVYVSNIDSNGLEVFRATDVPNVKLAGTPAVGPFGATLTGEIEPEGASEAGYYFEYGTPGALGHATPAVPVAALSEWLPAEASVEGLEPNTEYGYRLVGTSSSGLLVNPSVEEGRFTTSIDKPEVTEAQAIDITPIGAVFSGAVNPENTLPTTYHFEYESEGCSTTPGCAATVLSTLSIAASAQPEPVAQSLGEGAKLTPATAYRLRLCARNPANAPGEESCGPEETFTTPSAETGSTLRPSVQTLPATGVSQTAATVSGIVDSDADPTTYEFEVGVTSAYGTTLYGRDETVGPQTFERALTGLAPGTTYDYRICATNRNGTACGTGESFTTPGLPGSMLSAPPAAPLIASTPVAFPTELGTVPTIPKKLTNAQKLAKALKACRKDRGRHRRAVCERRARGRFAAKKGPRR